MRRRCCCLIQPLFCRDDCVLEAASDDDSDDEHPLKSSSDRKLDELERLMRQPRASGADTYWKHNFPRVCNGPLDELDECFRKCAPVQVRGYGCCSCGTLPCFQQAVHVHAVVMAASICVAWLHHDDHQLLWPIGSAPGRRTWTSASPAQSYISIMMGTCCICRLNNLVVSASADRAAHARPGIPARHHRATPARS